MVELRATQDCYTALPGFHTTCGPGHGFSTACAPPDSDTPRTVPASRRAQSRSFATRASLEGEGL